MSDLAGRRIGVVGLGLMGAPMARNLMTAGAALVVHNRSPKNMGPLVADGAEGADNPAEVAASTAGGIIVVCVTDTAALEAVIRGGEGGRATGLLSALAPGTLVIDMGTSDVAATRALAAEVEAAGGRYIDAPVSGGEIGAQAGTLAIMAGGADEDIARARALFEVLGDSITHIGPVGTGQVAKAANQAIVAMTLDAVAEGLTLAKAAGADPARVREALLGGFAASRILEVHGQRMIDRSFAPGGRAGIQLKDIRQALALAEEAGLALPGLRLAGDLWAEMVARGWGELDQAGIVRLIEALAEAEPDAGEGG